MTSENVLKANHDFSLIIFGASGHLAQIKIFPALYFLALKKRFPEHFSIVGYARSEMSDESFREHVATSVRGHVEGVNEGALSGMLKNFHYQQGQYDDAEGFKALGKHLDKVEEGYSDDSVRLAYFSIPPSFFGKVAENLCKGGIRDEGKKFRAIVEKPLGNDEKSAHEIKNSLTGCFPQEEIYLLDHYLGKEAARNIYYLRLVNPIVERVLKHTLITNAQITASESAGIEGRAGYFESVGTLRDMVQSHMLQLMALLTMQLVEREKLPQARLEALKNIYVPPAGDLSGIILQGQYKRSDKHHGYRDEEDVVADSKTPTFTALKLMTKARRWEGVPFYLRTGKRLKFKETKLAFEFKNPYAVVDVPHSRMEIILQGEAGIRMHLHTKMGGSEPEFRPLVLEDPLVCVGDCLDEHGLLLLEAVNGKQDWFLDFEEVMAAWKIIDPLQAYLDRGDAMLSIYPCDSNGPSEVFDWIKREGFDWI